MKTFEWRQAIKNFDERRNLVIPGDKAATIDYAVRQWLAIASQAIEERGKFTVALSGGNTPNAIYRQLSDPAYREAIDWSRVWLFWSDERLVPHDHPDSNYGASMKAGLASLPIPPEQIFPMPTDGNDPEINARDYEETILQYVPEGHFDLMMLGMGEDGHTASLFPRTHGLNADDRWAIANYVPQKETWRLSLTYRTIQASIHIALYVLGQSKANIVVNALMGPYQPEEYPVQRVGTAQHKALWILDNEAASQLLATLA